MTLKIIHKSVFDAEDKKIETLKKDGFRATIKKNKIFLVAFSPF